MEEKKIRFINRYVRELTQKPELIPLELYTKIFSLLRQISIYLRAETSDKRDCLIPKITETVQQLKLQPQDFENLQHFFVEFLNHLSKTDYAAVIERKAWKTQKTGKTVRAIPTMVERETLKYYKWLGENLSGDGEIVKLGCWLGATTCSLAEGLFVNDRFTTQKIFAFDSFRWEKWMFPFLDRTQRRKLNPKIGDSYVDNFRAFCGEYLSVITPRKSYLYIGEQKGKLKPFDWDEKPIKIYSYGLSGDYAYVNKAWQIFSPAFQPNETIIVFEEYGNLQAAGLRRFCNENSSCLRPIHKPNSAVKTFLFV